MKILSSILMLACAIALAMSRDTNQGVRSRAGFLQPPRTHGPAAFTRSRRLTNQYIKCSMISNKAECSSPYAQNYINSISECGDQAQLDINLTYYYCGQSTPGTYCWDVTITGYILSNCSGTNNCTSGCSTSLKQAGCCMNVGGYALFPDYLKMCGIPLPSPCANSGLKIPPVTQNSSCTSQFDYDMTTLKAECDNVQLITDTLRKNDCRDKLQLLQNTCSSRNGHYCFVELNITGYDDGDSVGVRSLMNAANNCPSVSNCSSQCRSSLTAVVDTIGCCIHAANATISYKYIVIFDSLLWTNCGVPMPTQCNSASKKSVNVFLY